MWRAIAIGLAACGGGAAAKPTASVSNTAPIVAPPPPAFCERIQATKKGPEAVPIIHDALLVAGASGLSDATAPLVAWLRAQPCVIRVEPDAEPSAAIPPIRQISIVVTLTRDTNDDCTAQLTLAPGAQLTMTCKVLIDI